MGYVRGVVRDSEDGMQLVGEWWEVGLASDTPNRGNFTLTMASATSFTGTWTYGDSTDVAGTWNEARISSTRPSDLECFVTSSGTGALCGVSWLGGLSDAR